MLKPVALLFATLLLVLPARAGVDRSLIPAGAQWVVHVDVTAALGSDLFAALQEVEPDLRFEGNADLDEVRHRIGLDPTKDIQAITAYGLPHDPEAAVVLLHTTAVVDTALERLSVLAYRKPVELDGLTIDRWTEDGSGRGDQAWSYVARKAGSEARIVLLSNDPNHLMAGLETLRGESASLADGDAEMGVASRGGAFVHISASGSLAELANQEPASNLARLVRTAVIELGEDEGSSYVHVQVHTASSADAQRVEQILQGAMALASLASEVEPEAKQALGMLQGLQFRAEGEQLTIHLSKPTDELVELIQNDFQLPEAQPRAARDPEPKSGRKPAPKKSGWY